MGMPGGSPGGHDFRVAQSPIRDMEAYTLELRKRIAAARERVAAWCAATFNGDPGGKPENPCLRRSRRAVGAKTGGLMFRPVFACPYREVFVWRGYCIRAFWRRKEGLRATLPSV